MLRRRSYFLAGAAVLFALADSAAAHATLTLTAAGRSDGFALSTFISGYSFGGVIYGPLSQGILPNGDVLTGSRGDGRIYVFRDVDGQTLASALSATSYAPLTGNPNYAITNAGGRVYGAQLQGVGTPVQTSAPFELFNANGTHVPIQGLTATGNLGMAGNPVNGHIVASANQGLIDIDPAAGTFRVIAPNPGADGIAVSPDGTKLFTVAGGNVRQYDIASGTLLHTFSGNGHSPDGIGVISGGIFSGDIVVNDIDGTVGLIDPITGTESIIASGGTRGDLVSPDTSNGSLFLSQLEEVARLTCGTGCSIGSTSTSDTASDPASGDPAGSSIPEPASLALLGVGLGALGIACRRRGGCQRGASPGNDTEMASE